MTPTTSSLLAAARAAAYTLCNGERGSVPGKYQEMIALNLVPYLQEAFDDGKKAALDAPVACGTTTDDEARDVEQRIHALDKAAPGYIARLVRGVCGTPVAFMCLECGALWRKNGWNPTYLLGPSWTLLSAKAGACCDNKPMDKVLLDALYREPAKPPAAPREPEARCGDEDCCPTCQGTNPAHRRRVTTSDGHIGGFCDNDAFHATPCPKFGGVTMHTYPDIPKDTIVPAMPGMTCSSCGETIEAKPAAPREPERDERRGSVSFDFPNDPTGFFILRQLFRLTAEMNGNDPSDPRVDELARLQLGFAAHQRGELKIAKPAPEAKPAGEAFKVGDRVRVVAPDMAGRLGEIVGGGPPDKGSWRVLFADGTNEPFNSNEIERADAREEVERLIQDVEMAAIAYGMSDDDSDAEAYEHDRLDKAKAALRTAIDDARREAARVERERCAKAVADHWNEMRERDDFETWVKRRFHASTLDRNPGGSYADADTQGRWVSYLAGRNDEAEIVKRATEGKA